MQNDLCALVVTALGFDPLDRALEAWVDEGLDPAAVVAYEVVMVLTRGVYWLVPRDAVAEINALHESLFDENVKGPVDACQAMCEPVAVTASRKSAADSSKSDRRVRPAVVAARRRCGGRLLVCSRA